MLLTCVQASPELWQIETKNSQIDICRIYLYTSRMGRPNKFQSGQILLYLLNFGLQILVITLDTYGGQKRTFWFDTNKLNNEDTK